jgi:hypothetical protein
MSFGERWERSRPVAANIAVVTVVALLLWFWAAGQTREVGSLTLLVRFVPADPERTLVMPSEATAVELDLQGSRRDLERASDRLGGKTITLKGGRAGVPSSPGGHVVDLAGVLARSDELASLGIAVVSANPASFSLDVLETTTVTAKVRPVLPGAQLAGEAIAEPEEVEITLPRSAVGGLGAEPAVEAFLPAAQSSLLEAGRRHAIDVQLRVVEALAPQASLIRIVPDRARITFTLQSRSARTILPLVPVQIAGPPLDLADYTVLIAPDQEFLRDVEIAGPIDTIRGIEDGRIKVFALVHLSADELALRVGRKRVDVWMLPPGVSVVRVGDSNDVLPPVGLVIQERARR